MAHNLTAADAFTTPITVPDDGDADNAASVTPAFQALADRTNKHENDIAFLGSGARTANDGVKHFRRVASTTALKALTGMGDGEIAWVDSVQAPYIFNSGSSTTEDLPWVAQPTTGGGRWFRANYGDLSAANGLPRLDGSGKVAAANLPAAVVEAFAGPAPTEADLAAIDTFNTGSYVDSSVYTCQITGVQTSDVLWAEAWLHARTQTARGYLQLVINGTVKAIAIIGDTDNITRPYFLSSGGTVTGLSGTITAKIQGKCSGGTLVTVASGSLRFVARKY